MTLSNNVKVPMSFSETQYFYKNWLFVSLLPLIVLGVISALVSTPSAQSSTQLPFLGAALKVFLVILTVGINLMRLDITADETGISYRMWPVAPKYRRVAWSDITRVELRTYKPIAEYGGWGWRLGKNGRALNVWGNQGIQLYFKDGKKLLLGTQKPHDWAAALSRLAPKEIL